MPRSAKRASTMYVTYSPVESCLAGGRGDDSSNGAPCGLAAKETQPGAVAACRQGARSSAAPLQNRPTCAAAPCRPAGSPRLPLWLPARTLRLGGVPGGGGRSLGHGFDGETCEAR